MTRNGALVSPLNIPAWRSFPLLKRLEEALGVPVAVDNDAKALALGEAWYGAGRTLSNFLAMVVSTGVGGGLVVDDVLLDGKAGNAGHIGHVIVEPDGALCGCGAYGCLKPKHLVRQLSDVLVGRLPKLIQVKELSWLNGR